MGLIDELRNTLDEFRNTLDSEDAKVWHEQVKEQRRAHILQANTVTATPATPPAPRTVGTATKRLEDLATLVEALPLAEHIDRLLGVAPDLRNPPTSQIAPVSGQVELLHQMIDVLDRRIKELHALVQRLDAV